MVWSARNYPQRFTLLSPKVREKAISIGNALVQNNIPPAQAERIAYERAVDWARRAQQARTPLSEHHVKPYYGGWAIFYQDCNEPEYKFPTREAAIRQALAMAQGKRVDVLIYGADGRVMERTSFA
jgi:hypothetical protein